MMNETSRPDKPVMIYRKTAILQKNGIFAAVGVYSYSCELRRFSYLLNSASIATPRSPKDQTAFIRPNASTIRSLSRTLPNGRRSWLWRTSLPGKGSSRGIRFIFPIRPSHLDGIQRGFPTKTIKEI